MAEIITDLSKAAFDRAAEHLLSLDTDWLQHITAVGPCRHEAKPAREPYEALVRAIAYQQLHASTTSALRIDAAVAESALTLRLAR